LLRLRLLQLQRRRRRRQVALRATPLLGDGELSHAASAPSSGILRAVKRQHAEDRKRHAAAGRKEKAHALNTALLSSQRAACRNCIQGVHPIQSHLDTCGNPTGGCCLLRPSLTGIQEDFHRFLLQRRCLLLLPTASQGDGG